MHEQLGAPPSRIEHTPTDDDVMSRLRAGDIDLLAVLFERHQTALFRFYLRMTGDRTASEDMVQEVFFRILKYRHTYQPGTQFVTWMYRVARNVRVDHARKRREEIAWDEQYAPAIGPGDAIEEEQDRALLRRAMLSLSDDKRELLTLSRFQKLKCEQIAALLGCETGTVKVRIHRALRELREVFFRLRQGGKA